MNVPQSDGLNDHRNRPAIAVLCMESCAGAADSVLRIGGRPVETRSGQPATVALTVPAKLWAPLEAVWRSSGVWTSMGSTT